MRNVRCHCHCCQGRLGLTREPGCRGCASATGCLRAAATRAASAHRRRRPGWSAAGAGKLQGRRPAAACRNHEARQPSTRACCLGPCLCWQQPKGESLEQGVSMSPVTCWGVRLRGEGILSGCREQCQLHAMALPPLSWSWRNRELQRSIREQDLRSCVTGNACLRWRTEAAGAAGSREASGGRQARSGRWAEPGPPVRTAGQAAPPCAPPQTSSPVSSRSAGRCLVGQPCWTQAREVQQSAKQRLHGPMAFMHEVLAHRRWEHRLDRLLAHQSTALCHRCRCRCSAQYVQGTTIVPAYLKPCRGRNDAD